MLTAPLLPGFYVQFTECAAQPGERFFDHWPAGAFAFHAEHAVKPDVTQYCQYLLYVLAIDAVADSALTYGDAGLLAAGP